MPSPIRHGTLTVGGLPRTYRLFVPPATRLEKSVALVFNFHPCLDGQMVTGNDQASVTHFDVEATTAGFIAVYPDGIGGCWNIDGSGPADDVAFVSGMLDQLLHQLPVDRRRVFATGVSGGAEMAYHVACSLAARFTGIASVSGLMEGDCNPTRPVSILEMHGTEDAQYPWTGGGPRNGPAIESVIQRWLMLDGCTGDPAHSVAGITKSSLWSACKSGAVVRLDAVTGGHHTWFGCQQCDPVPGEPDANALIWDFFKQLATN